MPKDTETILSAAQAAATLSALDTQAGRQQYVAECKAKLQAIDKQRLSASLQWALGVMEQELDTQPELFIAAQKTHLQSLVVQKEVNDGKM